MSEALPTRREATIRDAGFTRENPTKLIEAMVKGISTLNSVTLILQDDKFEALASEMREIMIERLVLASEAENKKTIEYWSNPIIADRCCSTLL